jgi:hypothetical protein
MKTLAAAIIASFLGLFYWLGESPAPEVRLISPQHDGHLWLCHPRGLWTPVHHPDCPCRDAITP